MYALLEFNFLPHAGCITIVRHKDFFFYVKFKLCLIFAFFSAMTRNDLETSHFTDLRVFFCHWNIQNRIVSSGIDAGWAASSLVSSARLQELREIEDATWHMITSCSWQSNYDSIWGKYIAWSWRKKAQTVETSGRCEFSICFHCRTFKRHSSIQASRLKNTLYDKGGLRR